MGYIIDSVNLVVIVSNRSCFYLFYGSCQEYLVCFITLSVFCFVFGSFFIIGSYFSSFHVWFRDILIDTSWNSNVEIKIRMLLMADVLLSLWK